MLGAFFYGYAVTQPLGGMLAERYGGKWLMVIAVLNASLVSILIPPMARLSLELFIGARVLQGLVEGVLYPAFYVMASKWLPKPEKGFLMTLILLGKRDQTSAH